MVKKGLMLICLAGAFYIGSKSTIYTRQAVVDSINDNVITFVDDCGYLWEWELEDEKPYTVGERVSLQMDDMNTESVCDDIIKAVER